MKNLKWGIISLEITALGDDLGSNLNWPRLKSLLSQQAGQGRAGRSGRVSQALGTLLAPLASGLSGCPDWLEPQGASCLRGPGESF